MVDDDEKQSAETQTQEEHEREQVGMCELLRIQEKANQPDDAADGDEGERQLPPLRVDHEPVCCRCGLRSHTKVAWARLPRGRWSGLRVASWNVSIPRAGLPGHRQGSRAGCAGARARKR